ncbi:hypothetical protein [Xenorhabdus ehlersii]|uniref:Uncharacterized protein n=1 Tax=Xenorhabdus ehlersii TaxID=290111 RepID=A0A2D0IRY0_9GAMM|nr:hypothetical protein [Xenorhabdus ehlersii]PHM24656.1 hypothetical protein Xehl_01906 [Xenorhabdus ehlersii]RKE91294.1 hypothetical protein BDE27_1510 [Xenorhabdus ehlersii]
MIDKKNILQNTVPSSVVLSVPHHADVIIGQSFYLYITLMFNGTLPSELDVNLESINGVTVDSLSKATPVAGIKNVMRSIAYLTIDDDSILKSGDTIAYKLDIPNMYTNEVHYTANLIDADSFRLSIDKYICEIPNIETYIDNQNKNFILYTAKLQNSSGKELRNTPIQISSVIKDNLNDKVIITTDPDDGQSNPVTLYPIEEYEQVVIPINSNLHGKVIFRVYPKKNQPVTLRLEIELPGLELYYSTPAVYMLTPKPVDPRELLPVPIINNLNHDKLQASGSDYTFDVTVNPYTNSHNDDSVIFFIDDKPVLPIKMIVHSDAPDHSFKLYYDLFPRNKMVHLHYVIAPIDGNNQYSKKLPITYIGGRENKPSNNIERVFDIPVVYASWADPNSQPPLNKNDDRFILECGSIINSSSISGYQEDGNEGYGLFIKIIGTNDFTDKSKPKFGDTIHFTMYINGDLSDDLSNDDQYKQISKSFSIATNDVPDHNSGKTFTNVIGIKYDLLANFASSSNYGMPMIYFEYYIENEGVRQYSHYFYSKIETVGD